MTESISQQSSLVSHLLELRNRLLKATLSVVVIFLCLVYFANDLYAWLALPLLDAMPENSQMIATDVASPFFAPFKLTLVLSIFAAIPFILHQIWAFIAPALYRSEKRLVAPLLFSSSLLFYGGVAFCYYTVFPLVFAFFTQVAPTGVTIATDISSYLDFVLKLFFAFGVAFEIPIAIMLMCWTGFTTPAKLREKRPYVIVAAFVIGMFLTPPDIISQTLLALPMWILFEAGVVFASIFLKKKSESEEDQDEEDEDEKNEAS